MIKQLTYSDLPLAAEVIHTSFATVAKKFDLTEQNCPKHTSFIKLEKLQKHFNQGTMMYGYYNDIHLVGYVSLSEEEGGAFQLCNLAVLPEYRHTCFNRRIAR